LTPYNFRRSSKAFGGAASGADGYGRFDPRDLGDKNQMGSVQTRYGSAESLRRLFAVAHASGLTVYLDLVLHQLQGANQGNGVYRYLGSAGKTLNARGPMNPGCFRGVPPANRPEDAVPVAADDFEFGNEKVYQDCDPPGYTIRLSGCRRFDIPHLGCRRCPVRRRQGNMGLVRFINS
jgi:alpha-amylase